MHWAPRVARGPFNPAGAFDPKAWQAIFTVSGVAALLTLAALEIVLGIDNIVFISVLTARLPESVRPRARRLGLFVAMISRIVLLLFVGWLIQLTQNLFQIPIINADDGISGKDLILIGGGAFLLVKAVREIHTKVEDAEESDDAPSGKGAISFSGVLVQIMLVDIVFSLDSVITAVGMTANIPVMILAVVSSVMVMMAAANPIADFVEEHPAIKILALSFLVLGGGSADGGRAGATSRQGLYLLRDGLRADRRASANAHVAGSGNVSGLSLLPLKARWPLVEHRVDRL